ncbi:ferredoxin [Halobacillus sp. MO56]
MAKYAIIDREACIGCGSCEAIAPDIFELDEETLAFVKLDQNRGSSSIPLDKVEALEEAVEDCPTEAIRVSDQPFNKED